MQIKVAKALGLNTDQKAAQTYLSSQDDTHLLAILQLTCDDAFTRGRQLLNSLSESFFEGEGNSGQKLQQIFSEAQKALEDIDAYDILLSVATNSGKALYLISKGQVSAHLKRMDSLSSLLEGREGTLISGFLNEGDRIFLATQALVEFLGDELSQTLEMPLEVWEESLTSRLGQESAEQNLFAGLLVDVEGEETETIPHSFSEEQAEEKESVGVVGSRPKISLPVGKVFRGLGKVFPKSGRGRLILAVLLILVILGGVGYKYWSGKNAQRDQAFNQYLQSAKDDYNGALSLQTLDSVQAKAKLDSAKDNLSKALALKPADREAQDLKNKISQDEGSILQQHASNFETFLDLNLVKEGFSAKRMSLSTGKLLLLDPDNKTLVSIDLAKKSNQILAGKDKLGDAQVASLNGGLTFIYSKDKGVLRVDTTNNQVTSVAKKDDEWGSISDLYGFSGNVYLLDSLKNAIWKYLPASSGYSDKREYFNKGVKADLAGAKLMQIESSIYILKSGGEILRYTKGDSDFFSLGGLDKNIKGPGSIFTSSEVDNLYILDSGNSRLVVVDKKGAYKAQYSGDKYRSASDLVVDEKGKKVYLLEGSKIYSMELK